MVRLDRQNYLKRVRHWVRKLRRDFPSEYRVVVRVVDEGTIVSEDGSPAFAIAIPKANSWLLLIHEEENISVAIDSLWHEWAHVLEPPSRKCHPQRWWDAYRRIVTFYNGD